MSIGKLVEVPLSHVWKSEVDFTKWLSKNLDILEEQLKLKLLLSEVEAPVGTFSADILAEDDTGQLVVIENQLGATDHSHLGQCLTYSINLDCAAVVWITPDPRQEHARAVQFINDNTELDFYLVKLAVYQIGDSLMAPMFHMVAGPSIYVRKMKEVAKEVSERGKLEKEFWTQLLEKMNLSTDMFSGRNPVAGGWIGAGIGKGGRYWSLAIVSHRAKVEFSIEGVGKNSDEAREVALKWFNKLQGKKKEIEDAFGEALVWDTKEDRRIQRILSWIDIGGVKDQDKWSEIQDSMIEKFLRLEKALKPHIFKL